MYMYVHVWQYYYHNIANLAGNLKFGSLVVGLCNRQIKISYLHMICMVIPMAYQTAKFTCTSFAMAILGPTTKVNSCQYFQLSKFLRCLTKIVTRIILCTNVGGWASYECISSWAAGGVEGGSHETGTGRHATGMSTITCHHVGGAWVMCWVALSGISSWLTNVDRMKDLWCTKLMHWLALDPVH